jgi:hypothetical protein
MIDVRAFSDFVETSVTAGSRGDSAIELRALASVIELVLDEVQGSSERTPHGIARTVMLVIADRLGGPAAGIADRVVELTYTRCLAQDVRRLSA